MHSPKFDCNQLTHCMTAINNNDSPVSAIQQYKGFCPQIYDFFAWLFGVNLANSRQEVENLTSFAHIGDAVQQKNLESKSFFDGTPALKTQPFLIESQHRTGPQYCYLMQIQNEKKIYVVRQSNQIDIQADKILYTYEGLTFSRIQDQLMASEDEFHHIKHEFNWVDSNGSSHFTTLMNFFSQLEPDAKNLDVRVRSRFKQSNVQDKEWKIFINSPKDELEAPITDSTDDVPRLQLPPDGNEYILRENKSGIEIVKVHNLDGAESVVCDIPSLTFAGIKQAARRK